MKKIFLVLFFLALIFIVKNPLVLAASEDNLAKVEYNLPYPGFLPDSPLYFLKVARDNVVLAFIKDDKQKAFYRLFLSDKRLAAGQILFNAGQKKLGAVTVVKAQEYYSQATDLTVKIKDSDLTAKMVVSGAKHEDVIRELLSKSDKNSVDNLQKALVNAQNNRNRVMELLGLK
jgi:hypothetical protein